MMTFIQSLSFANPFILLALLALPLLWFILRITPPAPKIILFPAVRFLSGIEKTEKTSSSTPWWILLLRMLLLACLIIGLSHPVQKPDTDIDSKGDMRIVLDNGWSAAQNWYAVIRQAKELINVAEDSKQNIYIVTTAKQPGENFVMYEGPITPVRAQSLIRQIKPRPWTSDYKFTRDLLKQKKYKARHISSFFLSSGLEGESIQSLLSYLKQQGSLAVYMPEETRLPLILKQGKSPGNPLSISLEVIRPSPHTADRGPASVEVIGNQGGIVLDKSTIEFKRKSAQTTDITLPAMLRNQITQIRISGEKHAGSVLLFDSNDKRRTVGIVMAGSKDDQAVYTEAHFYLRRALENSSNLIEGSVEEILKESPSVIILPDIGALPEEDREAMSKWVKKGGMVLRFAGNNMAQSMMDDFQSNAKPFLSPVAIQRNSGRSLDGSLSWDEPLTISQFDIKSPFHGIQLHEDILVRKQLLPEAGAELSNKTWATLADGTPLVTADRFENGMLILFHTTATTEWSDLVLSGVFVKMLERVIQLSGKLETALSTLNPDKSSGLYQPVILLDHNGRLKKPEGYEQPINIQNIDTARISNVSPPGIYAFAGQEKTMNLGEQIKQTYRLMKLPSGTKNLTYNNVQRRDFRPVLIAAACILFLLDWLIVILLQFSWGQVFRSLRKTHALLIPLLISLSSVSHAQDYTQSVHLGYISTGDINNDVTVQKGLEVLSKALTQRTSVETGSVVKLNPQDDDLSVFPLIYWPISQSSFVLEDTAIRNVQAYLDNGGTILFDTRDQSSSIRSGNITSMGRNSTALRTVLSGLNIPPLNPAPENHVLSKSFYLLDYYPGRYANGTLWTEARSNAGRDGVSSVLIGSNDWATSWAAIPDDYRVIGRTRQQELSLRFGINLMMYALTGNYKEDQVHVQEILKRLGNR